MARDDGLGAEPKLQRRQELSNRSRGHNEKSPKIGPNLTRFAYDRLNGHNPRQSFEEFHGTYARMTAIVWYRDDLRISDHPALHAAAKTHAPIVCIYVLDDRAPGVRSPGGAARWWLAQSLRALQESLRERGASLVLRQGPAPKIIAALARESTRTACTGTTSRMPRTGRWPIRSPPRWRRAACPAHRFPGDLLATPNQIRNKENRGCACSRRSGGGCRRWAIRRSRCLRRRC